MTTLREDKNGFAKESLRLLSVVDIFEPLTPEEIEEIDWKTLNTRVTAGEVFYTPMDLCESLFILQEGRVRIYRTAPDGKEFTLAVVEDGTIFGEMALTAQRLRDSYAQAMEPSVISTLCRADLERLIIRKPQVGLQLASILSERLARYEHRMEALGLKEVPARLASLLLQLIEDEGIRTTDGYKIPARYTHRHLGTMIGANREAVTRSFSRLQDVEAVELKRRQIYVKDVETLRKAAQEISYTKYTKP